MTTIAVKLVDADRTRHSPGILDIFNEAIVNSTALYDYQQRTAADMEAWFDGKARRNDPVICAEDDDGRLLGFATYGQFRDRPAYKYTVEHSVYVEARCRGRGVGRALLGAIIEAAGRQDYHVLVGGIDAANAVSIELHVKFGFTPCGIVRQAGFKFGRWLDLAFYQLILKTPPAPVDG
ncbi:MAG TPA: GNAT family N-acetyltransferase [Steroidobacteraceae bacterium]|nr:GNAT family N-acetyltransferase [Steroidobacteraceae bacterium]